MTLPAGYRYAATYAGIRKTKKDDLALIVSGAPASAAAMFTTNKVQASPVRLSKAHLKASNGKVSVLLINAGNANCATRTGDAVALETSRAAAALAGVPVSQVLPSSTGVIGVELDPALITRALPKLWTRLSPGKFDAVVQAIMTTDLAPKAASGEVPLRRGMVRIAGTTKGSGMIHPNMATMLGYVMMDAAISPAHLKPMLAAAVERSYHRITVDGDTSTNDTVILLANGASGITPDAKERQVIGEVLCWVMEDLAQQIARDGEGAKKLIRIHVTGAADDAAATRIARSIASSPLVKTAIAGSDPNWGRILCAAGYAGVDFKPDKVEIHIQGVPVCKDGLAVEFLEPELKRKLDSPECVVRFRLRGGGRGEAQFWTCDLTEGYIRINASYRT